jgi:heterodisulfide reductase subunit B
MKASYYPGCSLEGTAKAYDHSTRAVCGALGVELQEVPEWVCCGSSAGLKMNRSLSTALTALNLARLEQAEPADVVAPCPFCHRQLLGAQEELREDPQLKARVQEVIEAELSGRLQIHTLVDFVLQHVGVEAIAARLEKPLTGLKLIPYYGCFMIKPRQVSGYDNAENPTSLDAILRALGAEVLDWDFKTTCCGSSLSLTKTEKVVELSGRLVREAAFRGADAIVVACQLCHTNLDMRQAQVARDDGSRYELPVVYFTQLMGLAFGFAPADLGLNHHLVDPRPLLARKGLLR